MTGRERGGRKNNPREYAGDIWGNQFNPKSPTRQRRRKGQPVIIDGIPHVQPNLFPGADLRVPFPDKPLNAVPDRLGATPTPGTLFAKPEAGRPEAQHELFTPPPAESTAEPRPTAIRRLGGDKKPKRGRL